MRTLLKPPPVDRVTYASRAASHVFARAFSLIEVLLAIFILGVGVISIAALFPAGIAQQRASVDDILGPTIANNAVSLLRTKLRPDDFGTFEQFNEKAPKTTISGDFTWIRPGFIFQDDPGTPNLDERGAINIFSGGAFDATEFDGGYASSNPTLFGIPYNRAFNGSGAPRILVTQTERYYPSVTQNGTGDVGRPQYVWDCIFRKFQGKVLVAIFVYRVNQPGGASAPYIVAPNPSNPNLPPIPIALDLTLPAVQSASCADGPWNPGGPDNDVTTLDDNVMVLGMAGGVAYNPDDQSHSWQEPRQWLLDQNNNIHRVLGVTRDDLASPQEVELVRAAPGMPGIGVNYIGAGANPDVVSDIWYMPIALRDVDGNLLNVTPVYCTVKEL
jgi:type II secretory pathway pseudopilin PulG